MNTILYSWSFSKKMEAELNQEELIERANEKIFLGKELIADLEKFKNIPGVQKVQRKINQEIKFLQKVIKNSSLKWNHIQCSNLTHFQFLIKILRLQRDVIHLDCGFPVSNRNNPLRVDIVCENGLKWIKAIARNSKSLMDAVKGEASYGARSILDQAEEYIDAASQNLCMFKEPKVVFYFSQKIEDELLKELQSSGIEIMEFENITQGENECNDNELTNIGCLNLDITTLLAYVSSVCNGSSNWTFQEPILTEQAEKEREMPLKPVLDKLFSDKRLICCETAEKSFKDIIALLAGPTEIKRSEELMQRVEVLPDVVNIPNELSAIKLSGKINQRSLKIFAFGMHMKALTVTSNKAFVRSAKMQGINVPVFTHQARALTEAKESTAIPIKPE